MSNYNYCLTNQPSFKLINLPTVHLPNPNIFSASKSDATYWLVITLALIVVALAYFQPMELINTDLPRHLKNGQLILETGVIPTTNTYAYTQSDHPTLMHHWGSGVIFYGLEQTFGWTGLHLSMIVVAVLSLALSLSLVARKLTPAPLILVILPTVILSSLRVQIRPELFSYLLLSLYLWILWRTDNGSLKPVYLWLLPPLMSLWINLHIFFFLGFGMLGGFTLLNLCSKYLLRQDQPLLPTLIRVSLVTLIASLFNPYGFEALTAPFQVMTTTQSFIVENLSTLDYVEYFTLGPLIIFFAHLALVAYLLITRWRLLSKHQLLLLFGLWFGACLMALQMLRLLPLYPLLVTPVVASLLTVKGPSRELNRVALVFFLWYIYTYSTSLWPVNQFTLGINSDELAAGEWLQTNQVDGPILNNFNSGSYLIYFLYPDQQVFIDNRSEAYSEDFITGSYRQLETNEGLYRQLDEQYKFQTIFTERTALVLEWQEFIKRRIDDPQWLVAYQDNYAIILTRNQSPTPSLSPISP